MYDPTAPCSVLDEDKFGPRVSERCLHGFDFTLLFEETILTALPVSLYLLVALARIAHLRRVQQKTRKSWLYWCKIACYFISFSLHLSLLIFWTGNEYPKTRCTLATEALTLVSLVIFGYMSHLEHLSNLRPSTHLNMMLLLTIMLDAARVRTLWFMPSSSIVAAISAASYSIKMTLLVFEAIEKRHLLLPFYANAHLSAEATSGIFNRALYLWVFPLILRGSKEIFTLQTLPAIDEDLTAASKPDGLSLAWTRADKSSENALMWQVLWHLRWSIFSGVPARLVYVACMYAQPFLVGSVIEFVTGSETETPNARGVALGLVAAYAIVFIAIDIAYAFYRHKADQLIIKARGSLVSMIFDKTLRLHSSNLATTKSSAITLMSADVDRIGGGLDDIHDMYTPLIELPIAIYLLQRLIGVSTVGPVVFIFVVLCLGVPLANLTGNAQGRWLEAIQTRISATSQMLGSLKGIKMTGNAKSISRIITDTREAEIKTSSSYRYLSACVTTLSWASDAGAPLMGYGTFIILSSIRHTETLTPSVAFAALTLFMHLAGPMMTLIHGFEEIRSFTNCFSRIQKFLMEEERVDYRIIKTPQSSLLAGDQTGASYTDVPEDVSPLLDFDQAIAVVQESTARWAPDKKATLDNVSFEIPDKKITMIVGPVGSGKSTLLRLLLGEIPEVTGTVATSYKHAAYCTQSAWIKFGTIQENILGESVWDKSRYSQVVQACGLDVDFKELHPDGDKTKVGARGSRLSGGQQMRVALARALFSHDKVLVLDDVLTGLDRTTEQHILETVFGPGGLIKQANRTVILATNSAHQLSFADNIIVLNEGKVIDSGSRADLITRNEYLRKLSISPQAVVSEGVPDMEITDETLDELKLNVNTDVSDPNRKTGDLATYYYYFSTAGWALSFFWVLTLALWVFGLMFPGIWLQWWTDANVIKGTHDVPFWLGGFALLSLLAIVSTFLNEWVLLMLIVPITARRFHKSLLDTTIRATTAFITSTDIGQTINRFSQDLELIDLDLPETFETAAICTMLVVVQGTIVFFGAGYSAIIVPFLIVILYYIQRFYLKTSRQLRLINIEAKAPLFSHFLETLSGITSVRAYGWGDDYRRRQIRVLDDSQKPLYLLFVAFKWLNLVLNMIVAWIAITLVALVTNVHGSATAFLGVALYNVVSFGSSLESMVSSMTSMETKVGAVTRVRNFVLNTQREDLDSENAVLSKEWPAHGLVEFNGVSASYETSSTVLRNITLSLKPGEKIAVCGRTGSGKSSLISTLLKMLELESGSILVDGLDVSTVSRTHVRERLNTIPQEPFFVHGSIRLNVDPQGLSDDNTIEAALRAVNLWDIVETCDGRLDGEMNPDSLSHGQRQLFCLARAMCKPSSILILDEATSSVDTETEELMQKLIREHFKEQTVIAIAHKLNTVVDYDKVVLLSKGEVLEFDSPQNLLATEGSAFKALFNSMTKIEDK